MAFWTYKYLKYGDRYVHLHGVPLPGVSTSSLWFCCIILHKIVSRNAAGGGGEHNNHSSNIGIPGVKE